MASGFQDVPARTGGYRVEPNVHCIFEDAHPACSRQKCNAVPEYILGTALRSRPSCRRSQVAINHRVRPRREVQVLPAHIVVRAASTRTGLAAEFEGRDEGVEVGEVDEAVTVGVGRADEERGGLTGHAAAGTGDDAVVASDI